MTHTINHYQYKIEIGPLALHQKAKLDADLKNLDTLLACLKNAKAPQPGLLGGLRAIHNDACVKLTRIWNLLFGTKEWYNEDRARKVLRHYANQDAKLKFSQATTVQEKQLLTIYERLEKLTHIEDKNYLKGVNKEGLVSPADSLLKDLINLLPELKAVQKCLKPLIMLARKRATQYTLQRLGQSLTEALGDKKIPLLDIKAAKLIQTLLLALANDLGVDLAAKHETSKHAVYNDDHNLQLAMVPYTG